MSGFRRAGRSKHSRRAISCLPVSDDAGTYRASGWTYISLPFCIPYSCNLSAFLHASCVHLLTYKATLCYLGVLVWCCFCVAYTRERNVRVANWSSLTNFIEPPGTTILCHCPAAAFVTSLAGIDTAVVFKADSAGTIAVMTNFGGGQRGEELKERLARSKIFRRLFTPPSSVGCNAHSSPFPPPTCLPLLLRELTLYKSSDE